MGTTKVQPTHAHVFYDKQARMWGVAHGEQENPGFVGPEQRWFSFNAAYDTAEKVNRERGLSRVMRP
ncbi:hypothetical protein [Streptacidiphilus sp. EB103A]|uniref:hypothetical protein n=1 Tax=Streptacidiphilus sp. EB103A TaxID=3156275 RepID=UPI003512BBCB